MGTINSDKRCATLTIKESDDLFFPGPGGKVNKARNFCSECPVKASCLLEAIDCDLDGFFAGTTKDERKEMARFRAGVVLELTALIDSLLPRSGQRRVRYRNVVHSPDPYIYLDEIEPTVDELIAIIV
jgi:hypothetical protein